MHDIVEKCLHSSPNSIGTGDAEPVSRRVVCQASIDLQNDENFSFDMFKFQWLAIGSLYF